MALNRCQNEQASPLWQAQHLIHDLLHALGAHRLTTAGAMRHTQARKEQTEIIVDLCHSSHSRARIATHGLLLNGNRWRQTFDSIDIGLFELFEKLASISRDSFHIPTLDLRLGGIQS